jgi:hypothetical protein
MEKQGPGEPQAAQTMERKPIQITRMMGRIPLPKAWARGGQIQVIREANQGIEHQRNTVVLLSMSGMGGKRSTGEEKRLGVL